MFIPTAHTTHQEPPRPPMVSECRYQVIVDRNLDTYKCFTESEYQEMKAQEVQKQKEIDEACKAHFIKYWWVYGIGFIILLFWWGSL